MTTMDFAVSADDCMATIGNASGLQTLNAGRGFSVTDQVFPSLKQGGATAAAPAPGATPA